MPRQMRVYETGGADVMRWESADLPDPAAGEIQIRHTAIGLNFIDVYFRSGAYPVPVLPFTPGLEAAGVIEQVGAEVKQMQVGDRVAYASPPLGAYSERRNLDASKAVRIKDGIDDQQAAAMMLKGMTAQYLLHSTYQVKRGDTIVFHAAAGGVGLIACQWARHLGVRVIGTVSSAEKARLAQANGCDYTIDYTREDFAARVKEITEGKGVPVVYDSVGQATFAGSLACLQPRGLLVSFGQSSGKVPPFDIAGLSTGGSLYLTRPTLFNYIATRAELVACADALFDVVASGPVKINVNQTYALADAVQAHQDLENRKTTGSTVLLPD